MATVPIPAFLRGAEAIRLAACWAHVRRKFIEAKESAPQHAGWVLLQIAHLYRIEKELRTAKAGPRQRQARRAAQSRPIASRLYKALGRIKQQRRHLPQSALARAIDYALTLWPMLQVYLEDGRIEIDNNGVENAIRPTAIGKKNWLFIGEAGAGRTSAILYTIVEACRTRGIDPWAYLRDVLTRLPRMTNRQIKEIVPAVWMKTNRQAQRTAA